MLSLKSTIEKLPKDNWMLIKLINVFEFYSSPYNITFEVKKNHIVFIEAKNVLSDTKIFSTGLSLRVEPEYFYAFYKENPNKIIDYLRLYFYD